MPPTPRRAHQPVAERTPPDVSSVHVAVSHTPPAPLVAAGIEAVVEVERARFRSVDHEKEEEEGDATSLAKVMMSTA
ncbi:hypothetical protein Tdes44962_MAKER09617 [Teratosphaeria destructans]|uniref:Uncharacterized protein n=1 Tax=Teratosphaeria destructans TaxID=418781 RepID=A0A9W7W2U6_9PEZI|nr:hypothetical protein Tdes44962_MAKER09617 [Teratosphaeria destructans]